MEDTPPPVPLSTHQSSPSQTTSGVGRELSEERSWRRKFANAFRGVHRSVRGQSSFFVHFFAAALVVAAGVVLRVSWIEWCLLILCIGLVLAAETLNTALEALARAVDRQPNPHLRDALDISSGAVLMASAAAAIVGLVILGGRLLTLLGWWG